MLLNNVDFFIKYVYWIDPNDFMEVWNQDKQCQERYKFQLNRDLLSGNTKQITKTKSIFERNQWKFMFDIIIRDCFEKGNVILNHHGLLLLCRVAISV